MATAKQTHQRAAGWAVNKMRMEGDEFDSFTWLSADRETRITLKRRGSPICTVVVDTDTLISELLDYL